MKRLLLRTARISLGALAFFLIAATVGIDRADQGKADLRPLPGNRRNDSALDPPDLLSYEKPVKAARSLTLGPFSDPQLGTDLRSGATPVFPNYDIALDGRRWVLVENTKEPATQINVVLNWFEELRRLVPTGE